MAVYSLIYIILLEEKEKSKKYARVRLGSWHLFSIVSFDLRACKSLLI